MEGHLTGCVGHNQNDPPHPALGGQVSVHPRDIAPEKKLERDAVHEVAMKARVGVSRDEVDSDGVAIKASEYVGHGSEASIWDRSCCYFVFFFVHCDRAGTKQRLQLEWKGSAREVGCNLSAIYLTCLSTFDCMM